MRDVAAAAGVSVMTVSRGMNRAASVAPDTAARVGQAIADLGHPRHGTARGLDVDTVTVDNRDAAMRAVAHLVDHGHRRIAYLGDQRSIWTLKERYAGYRDALAAADLPLDRDLTCHGLRSRADAAAAMA